MTTAAIDRQPARRRSRTVGGDRTRFLCATTAKGGHDGRSDISNSKRHLVALAVVAAITVGAPIANADPWFNDRSSIVRPDDRSSPRGPGAFSSSTAGEPAVRPDDRAAPRGPGAVVSVGSAEAAGRPDDRAGPRGPGALPGGTSRVVVVGPANTFDWGDATIGALSGIGLSLLLVVVAFLTIVPRTKTRLSLR